MQNYGKVHNMFEPKILEVGDIASLIDRIRIDSAIHNWQKSDFENSINDETRPIYIIEDIGFVAFSKALDEAEILMVWMDPNQRKRGYAKNLLKYSFDNLKTNGVNKIYLEVAIDNIAALNLYLKLGFIEVGKRKNYYKRDNQNIDALILSKSL